MKKLFFSLTLFLLIMVSPVYALGFENVSVLNNSDSYKGGSPIIEGNGTRNVTVTFDSSKLKIVEKNPDIGRTIDAAWLGVKVVAPKDVEISTLKTATYVSNGSEEKSFWENQDSTKSESKEDEHYINVYGAVTEEHLINATKNGNMIKYTWIFDWDNDGTDDQTVTILINPQNVSLSEKDTNNEVWNADKFDTYKPNVQSPDTSDELPLLIGFMTTSLMAGIYAARKIAE